MDGKLSVFGGILIDSRQQVTIVSGVAGQKASDSQEMLPAISMFA